MLFFEMVIASQFFGLFPGCFTLRWHLEVLMRLGNTTLYALARAQIPPSPSPFNAGHAGYLVPGRSNHAGLVNK